MGARIYVGNLPEGVTERDLEDEFGRFGRIHYTWVARKPHGFAFVDMEDVRDAQDAVRKLDGVRGWRVEISRQTFGQRGPEARREARGRGDLTCYNCGEVGHLARDCRARGVPPRYNYEPRDRDRDRDRSPLRGGARSRAYSRSPRRSRSPVRRRDSRSPVASRSPVLRRRPSPSPARARSRSP